MIWPKRFKLSKAAAQKPQSDTDLQLDCVHVIDDAWMVATNGQSAARVPIVRGLDRSGADLPRLETGERLSRRLPLQAVREASKGTNGPGRLQCNAGGGAEAQAAPGKSWVTVEVPEVRGQVPNFLGVFEAAVKPAPPGYMPVEVCLDPHQLANLAEAIGGETAVRLRFVVNVATGQADGEGGSNGIIHILPTHPDRGAEAVLMIQVVPK